VSQLRFGILSFTTAPYDDLARLWRTVEALGFDSAWVDDDLNLPRMADFEAWALLGALARDTTRLQIGTLVTSITYRHPTLLAAQAITLDHLSHGRLQLGIGAGGMAGDYAVLGLDTWPLKERADRLAEQVAILDQLLRGESVTYTGRYYRVVGAQLHAPVQQPRPPLVIAGHGDRGLRLAARYADGWNSFGGQPFAPTRGESSREPVSLVEAVATTQRLSERLDTYCQEIGRDPATLRCSILAFYPVPDPLASLDAFDEYVGCYRAIGIDEITFYRPPLDNVVEQRPITAEQQARFERIATERLPQLHGHSE
jgi:alkanesulfonate monooxygenase SsuD/methylene tetrahydromethanopterin reductase-like flavin-dependent oxidoreductase (luciferase family)